MTPTSRVSYRSAISAKCKACIYDPADRGAWREQVAVHCVDASCALHSVRPVPRDCAAHGQIIPERIRALRVKLGG